MFFSSVPLPARLGGLISFAYKPRPHRPKPSTPKPDSKPQRACRTMAFLDSVDGCWAIVFTYFCPQLNPKPSGPSVSTTPYDPNVAEGTHDDWGQFSLGSLQDSN